MATKIPMTFSELIRCEEEVLTRLLRGSRRMLELVRDCNMTTLIQHLGQRQQILNEFDVLERQLEPYKGIPPEQRVWKNAEERQMTESALDRCKMLLDEIVAIDQESITMTATHKDEVEGQLRRVQRGSTVAPAYMTQSQLKR
jgi:hypothetical protein